ncbi:MAG: sugar ABC transporter permease [Firmicutes bacterium]|nr:sugar ABC transporter permease [Bacillota bacterium]
MDTFNNIKRNIIINKKLGLFNFNKDLFKKYYRYRYFLLMLLPGLIHYIIFKYGPIYGVIIAFKDYRLVDGILASPWVGLKHFKIMFGTSDVWQVFKNTLIISTYKLIFGFPAPIILALLINEVQNIHFKKTIQTISYMPHFLSWVVLSGLLINFLSPSTGPINNLLRALGRQPIFFVADPRYFRAVLVISSIWKEVGWGTIVYLASISNVDIQLYESAVLDGASKFKQAIYITLPSIAPVIVIMLIFAVGGIVNDDFDQIFNLYSPVVYRVADVFSTYVYRMGLENALYSFSTAAGLFKNVIAFILIIITNYIARKLSEYSLW